MVDIWKPMFVVQRIVNVGCAEVQSALINAEQATPFAYNDEAEGVQSWFLKSS